ncbi:unnamed protein product [Ilex paraguariensis]|uniref:Uncharacterized protein n=1 Tax=Ilex paraguariensis TaxID=185542 RepID=A0ABC8TAV2_9AQUA
MDGDKGKTADRVLTQKVHNLVLVCAVFKTLSYNVKAKRLECLYGQPKICFYLGSHGPQGHYVNASKLTEFLA